MRLLQSRLWMVMPMACGVCALVVVECFADQPTASKSATTEVHQEVATTSDIRSTEVDDATNALARLDPAIVARYSELSFTNIFITPAGPTGLAYTDEIRKLEGKPVRMTGYMVRTVNKDPDAFMFTRFPVATFFEEYGIVDDVPPNFAVALLKPREGMGSAWQPFAVTVFGQLELGSRNEQDGRISYVRIRSDYVTVGREYQLLDVQRPLDQRETNVGHHDHH